MATVYLFPMDLYHPFMLWRQSIFSLYGSLLSIHVMAKVFPFPMDLYHSLMYNVIYHSLMSLSSFLESLHHSLMSLKIPPYSTIIYILFFWLLKLFDLYNFPVVLFPLL
jgi:hypothetical protein